MLGVTYPNIPVLDEWVQERRGRKVVDRQPFLQPCFFIIFLTACSHMLGQVKPGEEVETQGRISALLASGLASWRGSENQEPSSPLDQVGQGHS
jgi:hypothetical protein